MFQTENRWCVASGGLAVPSRVYPGPLKIPPHLAPALVNGQPGRPKLSRNW